MDGAFKSTAKLPLKGFNQQHAPRYMGAQQARVQLCQLFRQEGLPDASCCKLDSTKHATSSLRTERLKVLDPGDLGAFGFCHKLRRHGGTPPNSQARTDGGGRVAGTSKWIVPKSEASASICSETVAQGLVT